MKYQKPVAKINNVNYGTVGRTNKYVKNEFVKQMLVLDRTDMEFIEYKF
ncbi:MAG: hypothetical protein Q4Q23_03425 [Methanobacteriaceae archaeon]|nr:hypothetical protein [Methanobacteriaceae archaeon]